MRVGICLNMLGEESDPAGLRCLEAADRCGFEYLELPVAQVADLNDRNFNALLERLSRLRMRCECGNNLFPASVRLTGADASPDAAREYLDRVFPRLDALGAKILVFGSSGAKNVPEGFPHDRAFEQIVGVLRLLAEYCRAFGAQIAIEPLNCRESNIILNLSDGARLMREAALPEVRLLVDYYHHALEKEAPTVLAEVGDDLIHAHFAEPEGRSMPSTAKREYADFFRALRATGYDERVSLEAYSQNPEAEMAVALQVMRESLSSL